MTKLKTTNIKGKPYVEVSERLKHFRESSDYKGYSLESEVSHADSETALIRAIIRDKDGRIIATGTAFERRDAPSSMVNKTSHVENCETSAWGRALGNLGIGIDESVASANEVANAQLDREAAGASNTPASPNTGELATEKQRSFVAKLAKEKKVDLDEYKEKHNITSLTKQQASDLIEHLQSDTPFKGDKPASREQVNRIDQLALETDYNVLEYYQRQGIKDPTQDQASTLIEFLQKKKDETDSAKQS